MGPTLTMMLRRSTIAPGDTRRVIAVSRWSSPTIEARLARLGIDTVPCDLADPDSLAALPDVPLVIFMAGQKFGTSAAPSATWATNTLIPAGVADRFRSSRIVAFSTGNVYPLVPVPDWVRGGGAPAPGTPAGSRETDPPAPVGEYASSCLGRERVLEYFSGRHGTPMALVRLNYAIDLRYGVLVDIAMRVRNREPVDLRMGWVNLIWQGDANARAIECLRHASSPPFVMNLTGREAVSVRAVAERFGERFGRAPVFDGTEGADALLSDTSLAWRRFEPPSVPLDWMITWVAEWIDRGNVLLGKPTHFETRDGRF